MAAVATIELYTASECLPCERSKQRLNAMGASYSEINIENDARLYDEMIQRSGGAKTLPQIFINNHHIGGCEELTSLHESGGLDYWFDEPLQTLRCAVVRDEVVCK